MPPASNARPRDGPDITQTQKGKPNDPQRFTRQRRKLLANASALVAGDIVTAQQCSGFDGMLADVATIDATSTVVHQFGVVPGQMLIPCANSTLNHDWIQDT